MDCSAMSALVPSVEAAPQPCDTHTTHVQHRAGHRTLAARPGAPQRQRRRRPAVAATSSGTSSSGEFSSASAPWLKDYRGAIGGGSGSASFGLGDAAGKPGSAGFACSPWHRPAAAKAQPVAVGVAGAAPAAGARAAGAAAAAERGGLASLQARLKELGLAGVMAYGLLNTLYYISVFAFFWLYVAKVPRGQGLPTAASQFAAVMAAVWAGSQVTKVPRAAGAVLLAPLVGRLMDWLQQRLGLKTRRAVFGVFVAGCVALALALFGATVLAWA